MTQKNKLELVKIKYAIKDMLGTFPIQPSTKYDEQYQKYIDGCIHRNDEQYKQMMERLEQLEEDSVKYRYHFEEQSVDIRTWTVESDRPLSDDEVEELCYEHQDAEGQVAHGDNYAVEYRGTEYGDDSQRKVIQVKGE